MLAGAAPGVNALAQGELGLNPTDRKIWAGEGTNSVDMTPLRFHSPLAAYEVNDLVVFQADFYRCTVAHGPQVFSFSNFDPAYNIGGSGIVFNYKWGNDHPAHAPARWANRHRQREPGERERGRCFEGHQ